LKRIQKFGVRYRQKSTNKLATKARGKISPGFFVLGSRISVKTLVLSLSEFSSFTLVV
jgi:hypothetical protein